MPNMNLFSDGEERHCRVVGLRGWHYLDDVINKKGKWQPRIVTRTIALGISRYVFRLSWTSQSTLADEWHRAK